MVQAEVLPSSFIRAIGWRRPPRRVLLIFMERIKKSPVYPLRSITTKSRYVEFINKWEFLLRAYPDFLKF